MAVYELIDISGQDMGWVEAETLEAAVIYVIKALKRYELDHAHERGKTPVPCQACVRIRETIMKAVYH